MKIKISFQKMLSTEFKSTFKRVMRLWPDLNDVFIFAKVSKSLEDEENNYANVLKAMAVKNGNDWENENPKFLKNIGEDRPDFVYNTAPSERAKILAADVLERAKFDSQKSDLDAFNASEIELEIPRLITVIPSYLQDFLTREDCEVLRPILDLSRI